MHNYPLSYSIIELIGVLSRLARGDLDGLAHSYYT